MTEPNNNQPLGQSISEIVDRTTAIVHEEIELAKAELAVSAQNLLRGSVAGIVGGVFAFFGLFVLLIGISFLISDLIDFGLWPGFLIVALLLFVFGGILAAVALKKIKKGSQLVPEQAIAEAQATKAALSPEPPAQEFDSVAVEETVAGDTGEAPAIAEPAAPKSGKDSEQSKKDAEAADLLAKAAEVVAEPPAPEQPPAPRFVTELPEDAAPTSKDAKKAAKAEAKAAKEAAKAKEKADKEAEKARKKAEKEAAEAQAKAEKEFAKAQKQADKQAAKAAKAGGQPAEPPAEPQQPPADVQDGES